MEPFPPRWALRQSKKRRECHEQKRSIPRAHARFAGGCRTRGLRGRSGEPRKPDRAVPRLARARLFLAPPDAGPCGGGLPCDRAEPAGLRELVPPAGGGGV